MQTQAPCAPGRVRAPATVVQDKQL